MPNIAELFINNKIEMADIFVPLGTQNFPFNRLITALNDLVKEGIYKPEDIVMQSTIYDVEPMFTHVGLIPVHEFNRYMQESKLVITHAGVNSIISCMQMGKALLIVPRLQKYGEHVDNHQMEIAHLMEEKYDVLVVHDMTELKMMIKRAKTHKYKTWVSCKASLIEAIRKEII